MAAKPSVPVEIGTRGTIGSLLLQEMEYFKKLDINYRDATQRPHQAKALGTASASISSGSGIKPGFANVGLKGKKKKRASGGFIPRICYAVDVVDNQSNRVLPAGFRYRNLRTDVKKLQG